MTDNPEKRHASRETGPWYLIMIGRHQRQKLEPKRRELTGILDYESLSRAINIACLDHAYVKRIGPRGQRELGAEDIAITISKQFKPTPRERGWVFQTYPCVLLRLSCLIQRTLCLLILQWRGKREKILIKKLQSIDDASR